MHLKREGDSVCDLSSRWRVLPKSSEEAIRGEKKGEYIREGVGVGEGVGVIGDECLTFGAGVVFARINQDS